MKRTPEETSARKRVAIYTRKSTSAGLEQEFNSLDAQRESCEAYAKSQGWRVVSVHDDGGFTGANIDRPAFQRLLAEVDAKSIDVVVVYKVDRLSRSLLDFAKVMERFNEADVAFVSVTQNFSTADAMGRLTLNMLISFAEFEREMIGERTRDKILAARRKGKWTGGTTPLGYYLVDKKLVKNVPEAIVVQEVFDLYEKRRSALEVMRELRARDRRMKKRSWTKDGVLRVLKNPLYVGMIGCGKKEMCRGEHEAIIARDQFERVSLLLERPPLTRSGTNPAYLLRGLLRCGACGAAMTPASARQYRYYRCATRDKEGVSACPTLPHSAKALEEYVVEQLRAFASDPKDVTTLLERARARCAHERSALVAARGHLPAKVAKLSAEVRVLLDASAALAKRARGAADKRLESALAEQQQAEAELGAIERKLAMVDVRGLGAEWIAESLQAFDGVWELMTSDNQQRLVTALVKHVIVHKEELEIVLADGLDESRSAA